MQKPKQQTNLTLKNWLQQVKDVYPTAAICSCGDTQYVYPSLADKDMLHTKCLGGYCSTGKYGWVK
jgi:hypothetical protein